jgi:O-antigen ligase
VAQSWGSPIYAELGDQAPQRTVDNFWLHLLVEFGILGTLAYMAIYVVAALRPLLAAWRQHGLRLVFLAGALAAMGALAIDSVTEMILEGNTFSMLAWLLVGATAAVYRPVLRQAPVQASSEPSAEGGAAEETAQN